MSQSAKWKIPTCVISWGIRKRRNIIQSTLVSITHAPSTIVWWRYLTRRFDWESWLPLKSSQDGIIRGYEGSSSRTSTTMMTIFQLDHGAYQRSTNSQGSSERHSESLRKSSLCLNLQLSKTETTGYESETFMLCRWSLNGIIEQRLFARLYRPNWG